MKTEGRGQGSEVRGGQAFGLRLVRPFFAVAILGFAFNACQKRPASETVLGYEAQEHKEQVVGEQPDGEAKKQPSFFETR